MVMCGNFSSLSLFYIFLRVLNELDKNHPSYIIGLFVLVSLEVRRKMKKKVSWSLSPLFIL